MGYQSYLLPGLQTWFIRSQFPLTHTSTVTVPALRLVLSFLIILSLGCHPFVPSLPVPDNPTQPYVQPVNSSSRLVIQKPFIVCESLVDVKVDASKSEAWGPGLSPTKLVFPARYFFVQLYDEFGDEITKPVKGHLEVHISGSTKSGPCRIWSHILNRKDGSYIVRYKLYNTCENLKIDLRFDNMPIQGFPKSYNDVSYSDDCNCPENFNTWLKDMKCKESYSQMEEDLKRFPSVTMSKIYDKIIQKFTVHTGSISLCHYIIKGNEVFRKCFGEYVGFKIFMDAILLSLARKIKLPDFEMFVNLGDWPLEKKNQNPLPIFSWCGSDITTDIVMPTHDLTESTLETMGRVALDMLSVQGNSPADWDNKDDKAFWRGRDSREERLHLIDLSRKHPDLLNASLTNFFFFRDKEKEYGPKTEHISFFNFFKYKYQINIDGTVASYRFPYLLAGDSVVLKQDSPYYEHFYKDLSADIHYVPFRRDLSDLVDKIKWLRENDEVARNISRHAQEFTRENLMPKDVFCYYAVLFKEWSSRLTETPKVLSEMEHVPQPASETPCKCRSPPKDEL